jgi:hypothetical protein
MNRGPSWLPWPEKGFFFRNSFSPCIMVRFCLAPLIPSLARSSRLIKVQSSPLCPNHAVPIKLSLRAAFLETGTRRKRGQKAKLESGTTLFRRRDIYWGRRIYSWPGAPPVPFAGDIGHNNLPLSRHNNPDKTKQAKSNVRPIDYRPHVQTRISSSSTTPTQYPVPSPQEPL